MATTRNGRTPVTTNWGKIRLGGAYLTNTLGEYITTSLGERIILIIPGGDLPINTWGSRDGISTSWNGRTLI